MIFKVFYLLKINLKLFMLNSNNKSIAITIIVVIIVTLGLAFYFLRQQAITKSKSISLTSTSNIQNLSSENGTGNVNVNLSKISGNYSGNSKFLIDSLTFINSVFSLEKDLTFKLSSKDFDTRQWQNEDLKINGDYPTLSIFLTGKVYAQQDKTYNLEINDIFLEIYARGRVLDKLVSEQILTELASHGKPIDIPKASKENPLIVNSTLELAEQKVIIKSTEKTSTYFFFEGNNFLMLV